MGFGKRYGADFADEAISEIFGGGVYPSLFRRDPRYFRMEHGSVWKRSLYAMSRVVWTRDDIGELEFNSSSVLGDYSAAAISNLYYPRPTAPGGRLWSAEASCSWKTRLSIY
jgi:hypothetical protein